MESSKFLPPAMILTACILGACSNVEKQQAAANAVDKDGLPILTEQQKEEGIICVREPVTGSRISRKKCTTAAQREREKQQAEEQLKETQRHSVGPTIFQ